MYSVTVEFEFCYGHRLLNYTGKCHRLHGHNAKVQVEVTSDRLTEQGFVIDFTELKHSVKKWVDDNWDHKMILEAADPFVDAFIRANEPVVVIGYPPTAENMARILLDQAVQLDKRVVCVRFWETPTSMAEVWE